MRSANDVVSRERPPHMHYWTVVSLPGSCFFAHWNACLWQTTSYFFAQWLEYLAKVLARKRIDMVSMIFFGHYYGSRGIWGFSMIHFCHLCMLLTWLLSFVVFINNDYLLQWPLQPAPLSVSERMPPPEGSFKLNTEASRISLSLVAWVWSFAIIQTEWFMFCV